LNRRTTLRAIGALTAAGIASGTVSAANAAGVTVDETDGSTAVGEGGETDEYHVVLDSQPSTDVVILIDPDEQVAVDRSSLTFTPTDWDSSRTVTVSAVDDADGPEGEDGVHEGVVTYSTSSGDPDCNGIDVRDVAVEITDNDLFSEVEGPLGSVDETEETIEITGVIADVSNATITSSTATLELADVNGEPLSGRSAGGFLDGTGVVEKATERSGGVNADEMFVTPGENVIVGALTENTIPEGGALDDDTAFEVQGTELLPTNDDRFPQPPVIEGGLEVDLGTVPTETLIEAEGYFDEDVLRVFSIVTAAGDAVAEPSIGIDRARCKDEDDGELDVRGTGTSTSGSVTLYDDDTDAELAIVAVEETDEGFGQFAFTDEASPCPDVIRAQHDVDGSEDVAEVTE
jgi:hypothetical protein